MAKQDPKESTYILSKDGEEKFRGTNNECFIKLLQSQSQSTKWAIRHEGWKIEPLIK